MDKWERFYLWRTMVVDWPRAVRALAQRVETTATYMADLGHVFGQMVKVLQERKGTKT